jgi:Tol biopolymer transport system component
MRATARIRRTVTVALACVATVVLTRGAEAQSTTNRLSTVVHAVISGTRDPQTGVLTPGDGPSGAAAFSPDGRLVLFTSAASNLGSAPDADGGRPDLFLHVLATGTNVPLTTAGLLDDAAARHGHGVFSPVVAVVPEGRRYSVAFASESLGPAGQPNPADTSGSPDLYVASFTVTPSGDVVDATVAPLTVAADVVADDGTGPTLAWSSDGARVAFLARGNIDDDPFEYNLPEPNADLFVATVATGAIERLTLNTGESGGGTPAWPRGLAWSPDGAAIAFHASTPFIDVTGDGVSDVAPSSYYHGRSEVFLLRLDRSPRTIVRVTADPLTGDSLPTNVGSFVGGFSPMVVPGQLPELFVSSDIVFPQAGQPAGVNNLAQIVALSFAGGNWTARIVSLAAGGGPANGGAGGGATAGNSGPFAAATGTGRVMVGFSSTALDLWDGAHVGPTASPAAQAYLADGAGAVALLSRAGGPRAPANDASTDVTVAPGRLGPTDVAFLASHATPWWTLAAFSTLATDLGPFVQGVPHVIVAAVAAPGSPATDDTFRATIERPTYVSYETLLANDAPGLTFVGLVGPTSGPTYFVLDDTNTQFVRFNHIGTAPETVTFQYEAEDVTGARFTSTVTMNVTNRRPLPAADVIVPVTPGQPVDVLFADIVGQPGNGDPDGDPLIVAYHQLIDPGPLGTLSGSEGAFHFTPAADYAGGYAFAFALKDVVDYGGAQSDSYSDNGTIRFVVAGPALPTIDFGPTVYIGCCEGTAPGAAGSITVALERRGDLSRESTVTYALSGGPAPSASGDDIVGGFVSGSVTFAANQVWASITILTTPDSLDEPDEHVLLTLTGAAGATLTRTSLYQAIFDDDLPPPASADVRVSLTATPQVVDVLQPVRIVAVVANGFLGDATNVTFSGLDAIVNTHIIDSVTPSQGTCEPVAPPSPLRCTLGTLAVWSAVTINIVARPTASVFQGASQLTADVTMNAVVTANESDPSPADNTASGVFTVRRPTADLSLTVSLADPQVTEGGTSTATIRVLNAGPDTASGTVRVVLPAASAVAGAAPGYDPATRSWTFGPVPSGGVATLALTLRFDAPGSAAVGGEIVTASLPDPDSSPGNGTAAGEDDAAVATLLVVARRPNLRAFKFALDEVGQQVSTITTTEGARVVFQMGAVNTVTGGTGVGPTTGPVTLTDTLPAGLAFVAPASDPRCSAVGQAVTCVDGAVVPPNGTVRFFVATSVQTGVAPGATANLYNAAVVSTRDDVVPDDNTSYAVTITVTRPAGADLALSVSSSAASIVVGQPVTITAVVTNIGPSAATGVTLTGFQELTAFDNLSMSTTQGRCPTLFALGQPMRCTLGAVAPGASVTVTIAATAAQRLFAGATGSSVSVTPGGIISANEVDPQPGNNAATGALVVSWPADVAPSNGRFITAASPGPVGSAVVGDTLNYRVTVSNAGGPTSGPVTVRTTLAGMVPVNLPPSCTAPAPFVVSCTIVALAPGASTDVGFWLTIGPGAVSGPISMPVPATTTVSTPGEARTTNNTIQTILWIVNRPNLRVRSASFTDTSNRPIAIARVGDRVLFTAVIENVGQVDSPGVDVSMAMLGGRVSWGGFCTGQRSAGPTTSVCRTSGIGPGQSTTIDVAFEILPWALPSGQTSALATASARILDLSANTGQAAITVIDRLRPDLTIGRAFFTTRAGAPVTTARVGDLVLFKVEIRNVGGAQSAPLRLDTAMLGAEWAGTCIRDCSVRALNPGESELVSVWFVIRANAVSYGPVLTATAEVRERGLAPRPAAEINLSNNTGSATLTVSPR